MVFSSASVGIMLAIIEIYKFDNIAEKNTLWIHTPKNINFLLRVNNIANNMAEYRINLLCQDYIRITDSTEGITVF